MILVFNESLDGHRLEYFHHLYMHAINNSVETYVFSAPDSSKSLMSGLQWPKSDNVIMSFFSGKTRSRFRLVNAYFHCKDLKYEIKRYKPQKVVLMDLMAYMPFIPFVNLNTTISGIIYRIYLYTWKKDSIFKRIKNIISYNLLIYGKSISRVYVQSDLIGYKYLNKKYNTQKFGYLCDPVVLIDKSSSVNLRKELNIDKSSIVVLHPGGLSERKGTLSLLEGISLLHTSLLTKYTWIFAGKVSPSIKEEFYSYIDSLKNRTRIIVFDDFVDFSFLGSLFYTCDLIAIPYLDTTQSSGIVGYAAEFDKPVMVSKDGLLGKIVRRNHLGYTIDDTTPECIVDFLSNFPQHIVWDSNNEYMKMNTIEEFSLTLLS